MSFLECSCICDIGYELNSFLPFSEIETEEYLQGHKNKKTKNDNIEVDLKRPRNFCSGY